MAAEMGRWKGVEIGFAEGLGEEGSGKAEAEAE